MKHECSMGVSIHWTGLLDWTTGLDYCTGLLDCWTQLLLWTTGLTQTAIKCPFQCRAEAKHAYSAYSGPASCFKSMKVTDHVHI